MNKQKKFSFYIIGFVIIFSLLYLFTLSAPEDFPAGTIIRIEEGASLRSVSAELARKHIIRSRLAFESIVIIYGGEKHIIYSDYLFETGLPAFEIARRIIKGEHRLPPVAVTIPEGSDIVQIADTFASKLPDFNKSKFLAKAQPLQGYLFPDTYFFLTTDDEESVLKLLNQNFIRKIKIIQPDIVKSGKTEKEIIIMASIIERESKGDVDRGFISGILWKRLRVGMPLQVDAAPDTYKTKGLPKSAISNPGLEALKAAIYPQNSPYLYYLHDKSGNIHYARTFGEHISNKFKYLQ